MPSDESSASPCAACPIRDRAHSFCSALNAAKQAASPEWKRSSRQSFTGIRAHQPILNQRDKTDDIYVLCFGWALRYLRIAEGSRQILSVLMAGDVISYDALFGLSQTTSAQALTEIRISRIDGQSMRALVAEQPTIHNTLAELCIQEKDSTYRLLANVAQRSALQRISYMILLLIDRLHERNIILDSRYPFPLRQRDIADLLGMTSVHVSRVLGELQRREIIEIGGSYLEVLDRPALEQIGRLNA